MQKAKITLSYDGSAFQGSQIQPNKQTVQGSLQQALCHLNIDAKLEFSGRTDKDVHAFKQVVTFLLPEFWDDTEKLHKKLNILLPSSISIRKITKVSENFHARFSAKKREYRYLFSDIKPTPFHARFISYYKQINEDRIKETMKFFVGIHDFALFSKKGSEPKSTIRHIENIQLYRFQNLYVMHFQANSYLRSQIRMMVDFIMKVSNGELSNENLLSQLECKKQVSTNLASPNGLYLSKIIY